jgi:hypothetical protein
MNYDAQGSFVKTDGQLFAAAVGFSIKSGRTGSRLSQSKESNRLFQNMTLPQDISGGMPGISFCEEIEIKR